jgi:small-conductance mechanosensitive channel
MTFLANILSEAEGILTFAIVFTAFYLLRAVILRRLYIVAEKTKNNFDDIAVNTLKTVNLFSATVISLYTALLITQSPLLDSIIVKVVLVFTVTYQIDRASRVFFTWLIQKATKDDYGSSSVAGLRSIISIAIWMSGCVFFLAIAGFNISSLLAGLGIGGLAVALALQNILADVFSSFTIFFDRPFAVGDYIKFNAFEGQVEQIGLKTTRIRSLYGEQIIVSNRALTEGEVQNFGRLERRRISSVLGFGYSTSNSELEKIPSDVESLVKEIDGLTFERMYFKEFGESNLNYELVYFVETPDIDRLVSATNTLNLALKSYFEAHKIDIAYPTSTVIIEKGA